MGSTAPVLLNIGGTTYATTVDTLTLREPESLLADMLTGRHTVCRDPDTGMVFIDRDGKHFKYLLNWLSYGVLPFLHDSHYQKLLHEAEYYHMPGLVDYIQKIINKKQDDNGPKLMGRYTIKCIHSKRVQFRSINASTKLSSHGQTFRKLNLGCEFIGANLLESTLDRAKLQSANLQDASLVGCRKQIFVQHICRVLTCQPPTSQEQILKEPISRVPS